MLDELTDLKKENPDFMPRLSHRLRRMQTDRPVLLTYERIRELVADRLPSVREQQESLLLAIGDKLREGNPTGFYEITSSVAPFLTSWIGAFDRNSLFEILAQMSDAHLIKWKNEVSRNYVWVYPSGWDRYEEIKIAPSQARLAFMAMPFENPELDRVYNECFKNAVKETGFTLRRVDEKQPAGLIDDQIRVRIRASRFVIAELTTENRGVYWEAGFAEGLGRPVIYTCQKSAKSQLETHFDTNHHLTVQWEVDKLSEASSGLKATIRATLPIEAKQSDE